MTRPRRVNQRRRLLLRWGSGGLTILLLAAALVAITSRDKGREVPAARGKVEGLTNVLERHADRSAIRFEEGAAAAGLDFRHFPDTRASLLPEDMGSGIAVGDYDGDGHEDVYLVNFARSIGGGAPLPGAGDSANPNALATGHNALFRNRGDGTFTDVTVAAGVGRSAFGMGAAWGDYDNDGDLDLYVTHYGPNVLYRNQAGRFEDVTAQAGVAGDSFSAGCAWADYDRDGDLDLYVCSYVDFKRRDGDNGRRLRQYGAETPYTLNPSSYDAVPNQLYRNQGDGIFMEVAREAGVADPEGRSLGALWMDMDLDGWVDLYVANDISYNAVFHNQGDGRFVDIGPESLAADYRGAMGLAVDDYDHDGDLDLLVTHWIAQENALYENMLIGPAAVTGSGPASPTPTGDPVELLMFFDHADRLRLGQSSLDVVGWATGFADFDNDGWSDLWIVNGSTMEEPDDHRRLVPQEMLLYERAPKEGFLLLGEETCPVLREAFVGRGGVQADFDRDGRWDLLIMRFAGRPIYLRNTTSTSYHWIDLRLRQTGGNTHALGAIVRLTAEGVVRVAQVGAGPSYLSQNSDVLHFGLGKVSRIDRLEIRWPDGISETLHDLPVDTIVDLSHKARY